MTHKINNEPINLDWPRWLSTELASRYSSLSGKTLRRLYKEDKIYAKSLGGGKFLFDRESIDEYMLREKMELRVGLKN